jgi:hypothetical protein
MGILPVITTSWTRNPPEEWLFRRELPAHERGIHRRNVIPPGITSSFTLIQAGEIKLRAKSSEREQFQDQQFQILYIPNATLIIKKIK